MSVLIVIPCLNEEETLEQTVAAILNSPLDQPCRLVIVDGGSTDRTPEIALRLAAANPSLAYLANPKRLQSAAVNLAVATFGAEAEYLIRIDAHAGYPAGYCQVLLAEAVETGADAVVVGMNTVGQHGFQQAVAAAQNSKLGNGGSAHRAADQAGRWIEHGHHALMRIAAFQAVGGYDETFSHNEDAELDFRLRQAGFRLWLTGRTSLDYYPRSTVWPLFRQYLNYGRGRARTIRKHHALPRLRQLAPAAILPALLIATATPLFWPAALPLLSWVGLCLACGASLAIKARQPLFLLAGPAAMVMHLGWSIGFWQGILRHP